MFRHFSNLILESVMGDISEGENAPLPIIIFQPWSNICLTILILTEDFENLSPHIWSHKRKAKDKPPGENNFFKKKIKRYQETLTPEY